jgi:translation initiation factor RLI1
LCSDFSHSFTQYELRFFFTDLENIRSRSIEALSGGELQRFACAMVCIQDGDIFMFDEPSSYLDVKQRLNAAVTIRSLIHPDKYEYSCYVCREKLTDFMKSVWIVLKLIYV